MERIYVHFTKFWKGFIYALFNIVNFFFSLFYTAAKKKQAEY
jgi:hypothetical protein